MNKKLEYLQITRGLAALIVVLHHITGSSAFYFHFNLLDGFFRPGWNGVDFFFVLSGFIIYYIHSDDIGKRDRLKKFVYKRLIRIYPIYWVVAIIALFLMFIATKHLSNFQGFDPMYIVKSLFLISQPREPFLGVSWSLCFEIFFYLIFALAIILDYWVLFSLGIIYFLLMLSQQLNLNIINSNSYYIEFLLSNYHLEFLFGIITAVLYKKFSIKHLTSSKPSKYIYILFFIGVISFLLTWNLSLQFPALFGKNSFDSRICYGVASGIIIFGASAINNIRKTRFTDFFLLLGDASYVLYLIHPIVLAILFKIISAHNMHNSLYYYASCAIALIFSVITGIVFHLYIEKKLLKSLNNKFLKK